MPERCAIVPDGTTARASQAGFQSWTKSRRSSPVSAHSRRMPPGFNDRPETPTNTAKVALARLVTRPREMSARTCGIELIAP